MLRSICTLCFAFFFVTAALARDDTTMSGHPQQDMMLHTKFYQFWQRPDGQGDCCKDKDCYPTKARFDPKTGTWWAVRREDQKWIEVPKSIYDNNDPNRPDSPDGQSHLCAPAPPIYSDMSGMANKVELSPQVYCFRAGTGM